MTAITTVEARSHFSTLINRVAFGKERMILTRLGEELAAVIPVEDLRLLERLLEVAPAARRLTCRTCPPRLRYVPPVPPSDPFVSPRKGWEGP